MKNPFDLLLEKLNIRLSEQTKIVVIIVVGVVLALVALGYLKNSFEQFAYRGGVGMGSGVMMPPSPSMMPERMEDGTFMMKNAFDSAEYGTMEPGYAVAVDAPAFSARNAAGIYPPAQGMSTGNTAEQYEVSDFSASIETNDLTRTCAEVAGLKSKKEVIFESASQSESNCFYSFKVEHSSVDIVLEALKALNPRDLSENTYTLKQQLEDFTSETEIRTKKLEAIESTLTKALSAYDDVMKLATETRDAEALASIINSKVMTIERLTQERIAVNQQLEYLARAKAQAADKLNYSFFAVSIYKSEYLDGRAISDSWKAALQQFVLDVNKVVQGATITLIVLVFLIIQYALYLLLIIIAVKVGWKVAVKIWKA